MREHCWSCEDTASFQEKQLCGVVAGQLPPRRRSPRQQPALLVGGAAAKGSIP